jgi:Peptidase family M28
MRRRLFLWICAALLPASAACSRTPGIFSEQNARAHIGMLAGTIGSRPVGTPQNARARAYIVDQLKLFGYEVRVQETDARRPEIGRTTRVSNIIATLPGSRTEALGLVSHYDSAPEAPGATDDGLGVGVSLEAARVLAGRTNRTWSLMVLVTDGEEAALMGAAGLMTDREVTRRLHAYVQVESAGSSGPALLFETGPGNGWLVSPWARRAPHPRGGSFALEIYRRLPNDTDFSIIKRHDVPGLNFAPVGDSYAYHTARDTPERLSDRTVRETGENVVAVLTALEDRDITRRTSDNPTYFDVAGTSGIAYGPVIGWIVAVAALVLGVIAWVRVTASVIRIEGIARWLLTFVWTALGAIAVVLAMTGATWAVRAAREVYHPWYARPDRLFALLIAIGFAVGWAVVRIGRWIPARAHGLRHPIVVWTVTLPAWIGLASVSLWLMPSAAYLWVVPLLAAGVLMSVVPPSSEPMVRAASIVVLAAAAMVWLRNTIDLLHFIVAVLGRLPLITPVYVYAAALSVAGLMIVPPLIASVTASRPLLRPSVVSTLCLLTIAVSGALVYMAPAYTAEQPLRRHVRALQQTAEGPAIWEVASLEPGLDLGPGAPGGWTRQFPESDPATSGWGNLRHPFVFRTTGPSLGPAPVVIGSVTLQPLAGGSELSVAVVPQEPGLSVAFVLPAGVVPARHNLPGVPRQGRWTATYIAPPADGVVFRASFRTEDAARLNEVVVAASSARFPGGQGWQSLPAWLPQDRTVWSAAATWLVPVVAPVPPLR